MAAIYGSRRLVDLALPSGWDGAALERFRLQSGTTILDVVNTALAAVTGINAELMSNSVISNLCYRTSDRAVMYPDGSTANEMQTHTEYSLPREERGAVEGHMAPRLKRDAGLGWSWDYLNDAIMPHIEADLQRAVEQVRNTYEKAPLTRLFASTHNVVETSGYDVGLADGNASTVVWEPLAYDGQTFLSTHTHYNEYATLDKATTLLPTVNHLTEHGHKAPFVLLASFDDKATYTALDEFTGRAAAMIKYGITQDLAMVEDDFLGVLDIDGDAVMIQLSHRIPTNYGCMYKPYGANSPRNPLRWWYNPRFGPGVVALKSKAFREFPVEGLMLYAEYGFTGGTDRTNGACFEIGVGGTYTVPTIT
jgi:hypothetical protein